VHHPRYFSAFIPPTTKSGGIRERQSPFFAPPLPPPASTGSRYPRAAPAPPPARGGRLPKQRAARRGAAERRLDRRCRMGYGRASGASSRQGLGTVRWGRRGRVFQDKARHGTLRKFAWTKIVRHRLVPTTHSPDGPTLQDYWRQRRAKPQVTACRRRHLVQRQQGLCPVCHQHLENGEGLHIHYVVPKQRGGTEALANLWLVHDTCHRQIHSSSAPLGVRRLLELCTR
jgi:hypothetical protein